MITSSNLDLYNWNMRLKHNVTLTSVRYCPVSVDDDDDDDDDM